MDLNKMEANIRRRLEDLAQFTATPGQGCTRLPFTKETRAAADYLKEEMIRDGLEVWEDQAGNLFGRLPGKDPACPAS